MLNQSSTFEMRFTSEVQILPYKFTSIVLYTDKHLIGLILPYTNDESYWEKNQLSLQIFVSYFQLDFFRQAVVLYFPSVDFLKSAKQDCFVYDFSKFLL